VYPEQVGNLYRGISRRERDGTAWRNGEKTVRERVHRRRFITPSCTPSPFIKDKNMTQFNTGYRAASEAIGNAGSALSALQGLAHCATQSSTADLFAGAVACVLNVYQSIKANGLTVPRFEDAHINDFMTQPPATMAATLTANLTLQHAHGGQQVAALCVAVDAHRGRITFSEQSVANVAAAPVEPAKPSEPIEVRVVSMMTRITSNEVERDQRGQIESAYQVQRDA
jgi:hypothetical protein